MAETRPLATDIGLADRGARYREQCAHGADDTARCSTGVGTRPIRHRLTEAVIAGVDEPSEPPCATVGAMARSEFAAVQGNRAVEVFAPKSGEVHRAREPRTSVDRNVLPSDTAQSEPSTREMFPAAPNTRQRKHIDQIAQRGQAHPTTAAATAVHNRN